MSFIAKIRKQSGLLMGILVGVFLLAFIFGSGSARFLSFIFKNNTDRIGAVYGRDITRHEYSAQIEAIRSRVGAKIDDKTLQDLVWDRIILDNVTNKEYEDLKIIISDEEAIDIIQGNNIRPEVRATFVNRETKVFDKNMLISYLQNVPKMSNENKFAWHAFEKSVIEARRKEKFLNLVRSSIYLSSPEIQYNYNLDNKEVVISYLYIPYTTVTDEGIEISDVDIKNYIEKNKEMFQIEETIKAKYLAFRIDPTEGDINKLNLEVRNLCEAFSHTADDIAFAKANTDGDLDSILLKFDVDNIPVFLKDKSLIKGALIGPIHYASGYKICKVIDQVMESGKSHYTMVVVEKKPVAGEEARNVAYSSATKCATICKDSVDLEKFATENGLYVEECTLNRNDTMLSSRHKARNIVKWLYESKVDKVVSTPFEVGEYYIVAVATEKFKKGTAPVNLVRDDVSLRLRNEKKGEIVFKNLSKSEIDSLKKLNDQIENKGTLVESQRIKFSDNVLPHTFSSKKAIGAAFGLQEGSRKIIVDDFGVFVIEVLEVKESSGEYTSEFKQVLLKSKLNKNIYSSFNALVELANVIDERYKYY